MSSTNASPGGTPPAQHARTRRSGESHTRFESPARFESPPAPSAPQQHGGWARCEDDTPPASPATRSLERASGEEPRTGVVRRLQFRSGARPACPGHEQPPSRARAEQRETRPERSANDWRCLEEWAQPAKERRARRNAKVTIVQLSQNGELVRQNGPDAWLPEAGDFIQRMSRLLAQGLGFERCRSLCLKGTSSVLTVTEAGATKVVAVSGPVRSMGNVLRRAGLE